MVLNIWKYKWKENHGEFSRIAVIENAYSVIWVRRFQTAGDFEVYVPATKELLGILRQNELFITRENDLANAMKIQKVELTTDPDEGDFLTISGKSAACIIGQRIVRRYLNLTGTVENCIYQMIMDECIDPLPRRDYNLWRKMDVLSIKKTELPATPDFTMLYYSKNVLDAVEEMCAVGGIGYKVEFTGEGFVFSLYVGVDRTIGQSENDRVIFSEEFENLGQCTYTYDNSNYCNAVLLKGANKGTTGISMYWFDRQEFENCKELCYYEKSEDGSDLSWSTETGQLSDNEYYDKMKQLCKIHMSKAKLQDDLNADIYPNNTGKFDLGDRVSIVNRYGITGSATVLEITETEDETGYRTIPTLGNWSIDGKDVSIKKE